MPTLQQKLAVLIVLSFCSFVAGAHDQPATTPATSPALVQNFEMARAISDGDLPKVKKLLDDGASINSEVEPPLAASAFYGKIEIAKLLLARGADPDSASNFLGGSSLYIAAHNRDAPMVKLLLERGARADLNGALLAAANAPSSTIVQMLLDAGANVNYRRDNGVTALWYAGGLGAREMVEILLKAGADPSLVGYRTTPAAQAKAEGHPEIAELITNFKRSLKP